MMDISLSEENKVFGLKALYTFLYTLNTFSYATEYLSYWMMWNCFNLMVVIFVGNYQLTN